MPQLLAKILTHNGEQVTFTTNFFGDLPKYTKTYWLAHITSRALDYIPVNAIVLIYHCLFFITRIEVMLEGKVTFRRGEQLELLIHDEKLTCIITKPLVEQFRSIKEGDIVNVTLVYDPTLRQLQITSV